MVLLGLLSIEFCQAHFRFTDTHNDTEVNEVRKT